MKNILIFIFCSFLISFDQKVNAPTKTDENSSRSTIQSTDSIRKLQVTENFDKAQFEVFKNKEVVTILSVKYNLPENHLYNILVSYTDLLNTIDLNSDSNKHTEYIKNYAFELGIDDEVFADLLLEYLSTRK